MIRLPNAICRRDSLRSDAMNKYEERKKIHTHNTLNKNRKGKENNARKNMHRTKKKKKLLQPSQRKRW